MQWILGHASLTTTQIYVNPTAEDVIEATLAHHRRQAEPGPSCPDAGAGLPAREPGRAVREGPLVTAPAAAGTAARQLSAQAAAVLARFPPRPVPESWPETAADRFTVARRLLAAPFAFGDASARHWRKLSMLKILDWLELHPGATWQQRWDSSGAGPAAGRRLAGPGGG